MHFNPMWIVLVLGVMVSSAFATFVADPDLDVLTQASTLIVVGELTSIQRNIRTATVDFNDRRINGGVQRGTFRIDQVLKGDSQSPSFTFEFTVPDASVGWNVPPERAHGLFFFKQVAGT